MKIVNLLPSMPIGTNARNNNFQMFIQFIEFNIQFCNIFNNVSSIYDDDDGIFIFIEPE